MFELKWFRLYLLGAACVGWTLSPILAQRGGHRGGQGQGGQGQGGHNGPAGRGMTGGPGASLGNRPGNPSSGPGMVGGQPPLYRQGGGYGGAGPSIRSDRYDSTRNRDTHDRNGHDHGHDHGRGAASDHYGSRRGLPYHRDRSGLGVYLTVPYGFSYAPYGYSGYGSRPYGYYPGLYSGYGSPYGYSSSYYNVSPYITVPPAAYSSSYPPLAVPENPPVVAPDVPPQPAAIIASSPAAAEFQGEAEQAFREHRYEDADRLAGHAVLEDAKNGKLYLFAAQTKFALGDYEGAAALIHQAANLLPKSEWGYVVENYKLFYRGQDFVTQMEKLVSFTRANPQAAFAQFLRGYQYKFLGYHQSARTLLSKTVELEPRDTLAAELLASLPSEAKTVAAQGASTTTEILPPPNTEGEEKAPSVLIDPPRPLIQTESP